MTRRLHVARVPQGFSPATKQPPSQRGFSRRGSRYRSASALRPRNPSHPSETPRRLQAATPNMTDPFPYETVRSGDNCITILVYSLAISYVRIEDFP